MGKLTFSIIVPVYNSEKYLSDCVESLLAQTNQDFEILLINDGSVDGSRQICDDYAKKYTKIRVFHKENGGASSARNLGIEHAKGEKFLFIDGDDTVDHDLLADIQKKDTNSCQMMLFGMSFDYYKNEKIEHTEIFSYSKDISVSLGELGQNFEEFFQTNSLSSACNKVFIKEIIDQHHIRFDELMHLYEDFAFVLEYLKYVENVECISKAYYHYRLQIKENHLGKRVSELDRLLKNLHLLENRIVDLKEYVGIGYKGEEIFAKLYMQLLYLHILYTDKMKESVNVLQEELLKKDSLIKTFDSLEICGVNEKEMLTYVKKADKASFIKWGYKKQKIKQVKDAVRPLAKLVKKAMGR